MSSLLLALLYVVFISLGLPDSLLGSAWPVMQHEIGVPLSYAGIVSMIIAGGTIVSSLLSDRMTKRLGAGVVTAFSVLMTAAALFGFSVSGSFWMLCLWAVPYGLGAGAVDAALNNHVSLHYNSRQMSWLHCFWGVGAAISPNIMGFCLTRNMGWQSGYRTVSIIQIALTALIFVSLPLWRRQKKSAGQEQAADPVLSLPEIVRIPGVPHVLLAFFGYCALESTAGLWASTYLVEGRGIAVETAARYTSLFFLGITVGRFLSGFVANRVGDKNMIRIGIITLLTGVVAILLPVGSDRLCLGGLLVVGLGGAPIYPSIIHATPVNFGADKSQAVIGVQMASAYTGSTLMPPLFGLIANHVDVRLFPAFLFVLAFLMLAASERLNHITAKNAAL